jgi:hypothetical protein
MKAVPAWVNYSVYRVLLFAIPLAVMLALRIEWWLAAIVAALVGLCLSFIFLRKPRERVALRLYQARHPDQEPVHPDAAAEDAVLDRAILDRAVLDRAEGLQRDELQREREGQ